MENKYKIKNKSVKRRVEDDKYFPWMRRRVKRVSR